MKQQIQDRKVSIITPCLNSEKTIHQTIESVLKQSYTNIEYIIIDGKSKDRTIEIIKEYIPLFQDRMKYISEKDEGVYDAMNKGIALASGDIVGIINSDDWYEIDTIEKIVQCFEENTVEIVYGNMYTIAADGQKRVYSERALDTLWYQMAIPHPTVFVKRQVYNKYGAFNTKYHISADHEMMLRFYSMGIKFHHAKAFLANFREGGVSYVNNRLGWKELYEYVWHYIEKCPNKGEIYPILRENNGFFLLENLLLEEPEKIESIIYNQIGKQIEKIAIFGCGDWGKKCYDALLSTNIEVKFFLDNKKEDRQKYRGKKVYKPQEIVCDDIYILVSVRNDSEIIKQLYGLGIKKIIMLKNLVNSYFNMDDKDT